MNKVSAGLGTILLLVACFLFLVVFSNGTFGNFVITGTDATANFVAFLYVIIFLPIGAGLAFYGYAVRKPILAASGPQAVYVVRSSLATVALVLAIIAILIGLGAVYYANTVTPANTGVSNLQGEINSINSELSSINTKIATSGSGTSISGLATVNATPTTIPFKIDWCNTDNTAQDRYCPQNLVVYQGDTVQVLFIHNDTDSHTFTIITGYNFQINLTYGAPGETTYTKAPAVHFGTFSNGMHNFITNGNFSASCTNSGTFAQESSALSGTYCVSGTSLLPQAGYNIAINAIPSISPPILTLINVTNTAFFPNVNISAVYAGIQPSEAWGIGAFQANTTGIFEYFCHYHVSNGMFGYIIVLPNSFCLKNPKGCGVTSTS